MPEDYDPAFPKLSNQRYKSNDLMDSPIPMATQLQLNAKSNTDLIMDANIASSGSLPQTKANLTNEKPKGK